jgi:hypothetical protein
MSVELTDAPDGRKLTYSEDARLSGKVPLTGKADFILEKRLVKGVPILLNRDIREGPALQDKITTQNPIGGSLNAS